MPFGMATSIQAVVIGNNVYIGGGLSLNLSTDDKGEIVMAYSLSTSLWSTLPPYETQHFGMAVVNNKLVLVGGYNNYINWWDNQYTESVG